MPVRKWLKGDIDYEELEASYLKSQMLFYKTNALAFGTTHLHGFTEKKNICNRLSIGGRNIKKNSTS